MPLTQEAFDHYKNLLQSAETPEERKQLFSGITQHHQTDNYLLTSKKGYLKNLRYPFDIRTESCLLLFLLFDRHYHLAHANLFGRNFNNLVVVNPVHTVLEIHNAMGNENHTLVGT